jgi:hypothetical protein
VSVPLFGGGTQVISQAGGAPTTPAIGRATTMFRATLTAGAVMAPTLPLASVAQGVVVWFEHTGDGTGTMPVTPAGGDTIDGGGPVTIPFEQKAAFISAGGADWRRLSLDSGYTPGTPGDWAGAPTSVQDALDRLAAAVEGLLGGAIP